jgi:hypothetical protein
MCVWHIEQTHFHQHSLTNKNLHTAVWGYSYLYSLSNAAVLKLGTHINVIFFTSLQEDSSDLEKIRLSSVQPIILTSTTNANYISPFLRYSRHVYCAFVWIYFIFDINKTNVCHRHSIIKANYQWLFFQWIPQYLRGPQSTYVLKCTESNYLLNECYQESCISTILKSRKGRPWMVGMITLEAFLFLRTTVLLSWPPGACQPAESIYSWWNSWRHCSVINLNLDPKCDWL